MDGKTNKISNYFVYIEQVYRCLVSALKPCLLFFVKLGMGSTPTAYVMPSKDLSISVISDWLNLKSLVF